MWNGSKFVLSNLDPEINFKELKLEQLSLNLWDRWIMSRLGRMIKGVEKYLAKYNFSFASKLLENFSGMITVIGILNQQKSGFIQRKMRKIKNAIFMLWYVLRIILKRCIPLCPLLLKGYGRVSLMKVKV